MVASIGTTLGARGGEIGVLSGIAGVALGVVAAGGVSAIPAALADSTTMLMLTTTLIVVLLASSSAQCGD